MKAGTPKEVDVGNPLPRKLQAIAAEPKDNFSELADEKKRAAAFNTFKAQTKRWVILVVVGVALMLLAGFYTPASFMQHFVILVLGVSLGCFPITPIRQFWSVAKGSRRLSSSSKSSNR